MNKLNMTREEIHAANVALAYKYDAFNDQKIKELGLCPICLIDKDKCLCREKSKPKPRKSLWALLKEDFL